MTSLITDTPRPNRISDMTASKFDLSVVTHGELNFFERQKRVTRKVFLRGNGRASYGSEILLL